MEKELKRLEHLAERMDSAFILPGTSIRFGWESIIGLLPGIGDTFAAGISSYILYQAHQMGIPFTLKLRMAFNIIIDWIIGSIPLIGDVFDVGWKANRKNVALLRRHFNP